MRPLLRCGHLPVPQGQQRPRHHHRLHPPGTDKLDLSQLLQGENGTTASLDDYLHFIDLAGVNLASHYGVTPGAGGVVAGGHDTATIISGMLNDHSLKVDTV